MGIFYRNSSGVETTVAGLAPASKLVPSVSLYQKGSVNFSCGANSWNTVDVTFDTPMPDNDYQVILDSGRTAYVHVQNVMYKSTTGFTLIVYNRDSLSSEEGIINWQAFKLMTDEVTALDEAKIEQNTRNFANEFSATSSYAVGDYTTYQGVLYRCTVAHTQLPWNNSHFTQATVGGDIASKIPSTASSTEKLAYVEYNPSTSLYSTWEELLELLYQKGAGYWTGTIYIGKWYTYTAKIVLGSSGYWYGSFLAKCAETEALVGASKTYSATNTWTVTNYVTEKNSIRKKDYWVWDNNNTFTINLEDVASGIGNRYPAMLSVFSTVGDELIPTTHVFSIGVLMTAPQPITIVSVGGNGGFSATASGYDVTITCPSNYCNARLIY